MIKELDSLVDQFKVSEVSEDEFQDWNNHPVTKALMCELKGKLIDKLKMKTEIATDEEERCIQNREFAELSLLADIINWNPHENY